MAGVNRHFPGSDALGKFHRRDDFLYRRLPYGLVHGRQVQIPAAAVNDGMQGIFLRQPPVFAFVILLAIKVLGPHFQAAQAEFIDLAEHVAQRKIP